MELSIDTSAQAAYMRLSTEEVQVTSSLSPVILVDYDSQGNTVGIEVLSYPLL